MGDRGGKMQAVDVGLTGVNGDAEFLRRLAARKPDATARSPRSCPRILTAIVRGRTSGRSADFVEDVVQDTLRAVLEAVDGGKVREPARFGSFVVGVCENTLRRQLHDRGRHPPAPADAPEQVAGDNPEARTSARESLAAVEEALGTLTARNRGLLEQMLLFGADKDRRVLQAVRRHPRTPAGPVSSGQAAVQGGPGPPAHAGRVRSVTIVSANGLPGVGNGAGRFPALARALPDGRTVRERPACLRGPHAGMSRVRPSGGDRHGVHRGRPDGDAPSDKGVCPAGGAAGGSIPGAQQLSQGGGVCGLVAAADAGFPDGGGGQLPLLAAVTYQGVS